MRLGFFLGSLVWLVFLVSCGSGGATLTADQESYRAGGRVTLTLHNGGPVTLGYNLCQAELWAAADGARVEPETSNPQLCQLILSSLAAGRDASGTQTLPTDLVPGKYFYVTRVEPEPGSSKPEVRVESARFEVLGGGAP
jgi:hypothetical protein